jgi:hypothetical protein
MNRWTTLAFQADQSLSLLKGKRNADETPQISREVRYSNSLRGLCASFMLFALKFNAKVIAPELLLTATPIVNSEGILAGCHIIRGAGTDTRRFQIDLTARLDKFQVVNRSEDGHIYSTTLYSVSPRNPLRLVSAGGLFTPTLVGEIHCTWLVSVFEYD